MRHGHRRGKDLGGGGQSSASAGAAGLGWRRASRRNRSTSMPTTGTGTARPTPRCWRRRRGRTPGRCAPPTARSTGPWPRPWPPTPWVCPLSRWTTWSMAWAGRPSRSTSASWSWPAESARPRPTTVMPSTSWPSCDQSWWCWWPTPASAPSMPPACRWPPWPRSPTGPTRSRWSWCSTGSTAVATSTGGTGSGCATATGYSAMVLPGEEAALADALLGLDGAAVSDRS